MDSRQYNFNPATCLPDRTNLPQSQSERQFRRIEDTKRPSFDIPYRRANSQDNNFNDRNPLPTPSHPTSPTRSPSPFRGRLFGRSSPTRHLEDLGEEDDVFDYYSSSPKRSRSPKKLFGEGGWLGRSPSIKEKKSGFKQLSEKLRQGVEGLVRIQMCLNSLAGLTILCFID
jgi:hypothetical protein